MSDFYSTGIVMDNNSLIDFSFSSKVFVSVILDKPQISTTLSRFIAEKHSLEYKIFTIFLITLSSIKYSSLAFTNTFFNLSSSFFHAFSKSFLKSSFNLSI